MPHIGGVVETCLYVDDLARARKFWAELLGLEVLFADERLCALDTGNSAVLLLFRRSASNQQIRLDGGTIPPHHGAGHIHVGLAIGADEFGNWRTYLADSGVAIESTVEWPRGGRSIYVRDPDGHLVEFLTPGVWPVY